VNRHKLLCHPLVTTCMQSTAVIAGVFIANMFVASKVGRLKQGVLEFAVDAVTTCHLLLFCGDYSSASRAGKNCHVYYKACTSTDFGR
jgi:hypothetical protein